jgi:hypothetical protein
MLIGYDYYFILIFRSLSHVLQKSYGGKWLENKYDNNRNTLLVKHQLQVR